MSYQWPQQQSPYQQAVQPPSNGQAVAALVLGIIAIVTGLWSPLPIVGAFPALIAFPLSVLAIIFGHVGLSLSKTILVGRGQALTGMILGYITLGILLITILVWVISLSMSSVFSPFFYLWR